MNEVESPIERLNYFNGQRLEANDLRIEQDYHTRTRRWLNKSLYTHGVATGLDVTIKEGDPHTVIVHPGLAIDPEGREIVLVEEREVLVSGRPSELGAPVLGNYLVIQFAEEQVSPVEEGCQGRSLSWGGPSRYRQVPKILVQKEWPKLDSNKITLAQLELDDNCEVREIHVAVRQLVGNSRASKVRPISLHGEKNINNSNSKKILFHIDGGIPDSISLHLKADLFSTLYYSELGQHSHGYNLDVVPENGVDHTHEVIVVEGDLTALSGEDSEHGHTVIANIENEGNNTINTKNDNNPVRGTLTNTQEINMKITDGAHSHPVSGNTFISSPPLENTIQGYSLSGAITDTGQSIGIREEPDAYTYLDDLRINIDGVEYTPEILDRLNWNKLGNGSSTHKLVTEGTGPIRLDLLGVDFFEGDHVIELFVEGDGNGGCILFNLYVD